MAEKEGIKTSSNTEEITQLLIENFAALQKVMADVAIRLNTLTDQIATLLKLFESAAKSFKEKKVEQKKIGSADMSGKIDQLLEQNKIIAAKLNLGEEESTERIKPKPLPEFRF